MNEFDIGYIMGLVVGEGCFSGDRKQPWLCIALQAGDPKPLYRLKEMMGGDLNGPYYYRDGRTRIQWRLRGHQLSKMLPIFDRYLPPSRKRDQYIKWKAKWAVFLAYLAIDAERQHVFEECLADLAAIRQGEASVECPFPG